MNRSLPSQGLLELAERIGAMPRAAACPAVPFAGRWLRFGCAHEWFSWLPLGGAGGGPGAGPGTGGEGMGGVCAQASIAAAALAAGCASRVAWVGRACWPYPVFLARVGVGDAGAGVGTAGGTGAGEGEDEGEGGKGGDRGGLLSASVFVDVSDAAARVWAMDVALRAGGVVVVGDGRGLTLTHTRRLQLAAGAGGSLCMLSRCGSELGVLSAAATRWEVRMVSRGGSVPRWSVGLLRDKERPVVADGSARVELEWSHASGGLCMSAVLDGRACAAGVRASS